MHLTLPTLLLSLLSITTAVSAQQTKYPFLLRAWRDTRFGTPPPVINHYVEIDSDSGNAVINKTSGYPGFQSYLWPTPEEGTVSTITTDTPAYLFPLATDTSPTHYQLKFGGIPRIAGVLYTNFTTVGRGCGGHCGGATLDYDIGGDRGYGEWYIIKEEGEEDGDVWSVRWIGVKNLADQVVYPTGAIPVFLWKN